MVLHSNYVIEERLERHWATYCSGLSRSSSSLLRAIGHGQMWGGITGPFARPEIGSNWWVLWPGMSNRYPRLNHSEFSKCRCFCICWAIAARERNMMLSHHKKKGTIKRFTLVWMLTLAVDFETKIHIHRENQFEKKQIENELMHERALIRPPGRSPNFENGRQKIKCWNCGRSRKTPNYYARCTLPWARVHSRCRTEEGGGDHCTRDEDESGPGREVGRIAL